MRRETNRRRRTNVAVAVVVVVIAAACTGDDRPSAADDPATVDPRIVTLPPPEPDTPQIPTPASADLVRHERLYVFPDPLYSLQRELGVAPVLLPPGEHTSDALGIEVTLDLDDWWRLDNEETGSFSLNRVDAPVDALLPGVIFLRPIGLAAPARVNDPDLLRGEYSHPPDDLGGWLDAVDAIDVLDRGTFTVGDRNGTWFDVDVRDDVGHLLAGCVPGECLHTWWSGGSRATVAREGERLRYYSFPDPAGPIYVLIAAADDEFDEWNASAAELLASATFGPTAPHPVDEFGPDASVGIQRGHPTGTTWRFPRLPGLTITAQRFSVSEQKPGYLLFQPWSGMFVERRAGLVRPVAAIDGTPLADVDAAVDVLVGAGLEPVPSDDLGEPVEFSVGVYEGEVDGAVLRRAELARDGDDPEFVGWPEHHPSAVRVWVLDSPAGPLLLVAEGDDDHELGEAVPQALLLAESIDYD